MDLSRSEGSVVFKIHETVVKAFIEPRLKEVSSGQLVTVQLSGLDALGRVKTHDAIGAQGDCLSAVDNDINVASQAQLLFIRSSLVIEDILEPRRPSCLAKEPRKIAASMTRLLAVSKRTVEMIIFGTRMK